MLQLINGVPYFDIFTKQSTMERRVYSAPDPITLNQWHYLVGTFDGQTLKIYVDGTLMGTTTLSGKETIQNWENSIYIGDCGSPPQNAGLRGLIDNVAIFKRAKTQDEVTATYNQFKNKGIVADWAFDENNGDTYIDSSGNANDGVRQGDVSRIGHNDGQAVYFDGTGSDIELVRSPNLIPAGNENYTVEGWIKPDVMGAKGIIGWGNYGTANSVNAFRLTDNGLVNYWQGNDLTVVTGDLTGSWHHVAATFDGTTRKIFLDGFCVGKDAPTGHNAVLANLTIGKTSTSENFKGAIDNLVVYNRALSEDEILREYKGIEDNTVYPSFNYTYDKENQLIGVSGDVSASYTYDFAGNRVKKVEGNSTTYTFSPYYEMENGKKVKHYYAGDQLIADNNDGQLVFYHQDHLGSSVRLSDASGNEIKRMGFMPYGENSFISGAGLTPKYQYTGQEKDSTGLYYYGARFYDPELGRFLSLDPLGDDYCYANNNPIMFNDPSGMSSLLQDQYNIGDSDGGGGSGGYSTLPDSYFNSGSGYNVMPGLNEMMNTTTGAYYANAGAGTINYAGGVVRGAESGLAGSFNSAQNLWNGLDMNNNLNTLASVPFPVTEGLAIGLRGTIGVGSAIINNSRLSFIGLNEFKLARASVRLQLAKRFNIGRRVRQALKYPPNEIIEIFDPKYKNLSLEEMMKMPKLKITSRDFYLRDAIGHIEQTVHGAMIRRGQYKKIINDFFNGIKEILNNK